MFKNLPLHAGTNSAYRQVGVDRYVEDSLTLIVAVVEVGIECRAKNG